MVVYLQNNVVAIPSGTSTIYVPNIIPVTCWISNGTSITSTVPIWNTNCTSATTTSSSCIAWVTLPEGCIVTPTQYYDLARQRIYICRERSEAEERRLAEEARQREARARIAQEQFRLAGERARDLLIAHLSAEQRKSMEQRGWFVVKGGKSGTNYRIRTGSYAGNIEVLRGDKVTGVLCCHCDGIPLHDHHLAQKLALQYDEDRFLRIANHSAR